MPPTWFVGCGLIALAIGYAIWRRVNPAAPILAAGTVVIFSQALMYGTPTVMAAARHIGLIEYIRSFGGVDASLDIYQGWPGLFAGSAWLTDATGISSQIALATWWPVVITPVTILAVRLLAGRFLSPNRAWVAAAIYALGDSVNSTYFSPQAYSFLVAMAVIALLVVPPAGESSRRRQLRIVFASHRHPRHGRHAPDLAVHAHLRTDGSGRVPPAAALVGPVAGLRAGDAVGPGAPQADHALRRPQ